MPAAAQDHHSSENVFLIGDAQAVGFPIRFASAGFEELYGFAASEVVGRRCGDVIGGSFILASGEALAALASAVGLSEDEVAGRVRLMTGQAGGACRLMMEHVGERVGVAIIVNRKKNGELFVCECLTLALQHPSQNFTYTLGFQRDITHELSLAALLSAAASSGEYSALVASRSASLEDRRTAILGLEHDDVCQSLHEKASEVFSQPVPLMCPALFGHVEEHLSSEGVFLMGDAGAPGFPVRFASRGFEELYGYSASDIVGKKCGDLIGGAFVLANIDCLARLATAARLPLREVENRIGFVTGKAGEACRVMMANPGKRVGVALLVNRKSSGELFTCECLLLCLKHPTVDWSYTVGFQRDISKELPLRLLLAAAASDAEYSRLLRSRAASLERRRAVLLGAGSENVVRYLHEKALDIFSLDIWRKMSTALMSSSATTASAAKAFADATSTAPTASSSSALASICARAARGAGAGAAVPLASAGWGATVGKPAPLRLSAGRVGSACSSSMLVARRSGGCAAIPAPFCARSPTRHSPPPSGASSPRSPRVSLTAARQSLGPPSKAGERRTHSIQPLRTVERRALSPPAPPPSHALSRAARKSTLGLRPRAVRMVGGARDFLWDAPEWRSFEANEVVKFLTSAGLRNYAEALIVNGFEDMQTLLDIEDEDMEHVGITRGHMLKLKKSLRTFGALQICDQPIEYQKQRAKAPSADRRLPTPACAADAVDQSWERIQQFGSDRFAAIFCDELWAHMPSASGHFRQETCERYWDWSSGPPPKAAETSLFRPKLMAKMLSVLGGAFVALRSADSDIEALASGLVRLGSRHAGYGLREELFPFFGGSLACALRQSSLFGGFAPEVEEAWTAVFNFVAERMTEGLRQSALVDCGSVGGAVDAVGLDAVAARLERFGALSAAPGASLPAGDSIGGGVDGVGATMGGGPTLLGRQPPAMMLARKPPLGPASCFGRC